MVNFDKFQIAILSIIQFAAQNWNSEDWVCNFITKIFYPTKLCLVAKHYSSAVLFVNKQKEEVMTELGAPATLSYFSSPGLRGCDVMRLARGRVLHLPRHFLMA